MKIYKGMFKGFFSCILLAVLFSPVFLSGEQGANLPEGIGNSWWGEVQKNIKTSEYEIRWQEKKGAYQSPNRRNNLRFTYFTDGFKAEPRKYDGEMLWSVDLRLVSYGRGRRVITYRKGRKLIVKGNTAEVKGRGIKIQYANNEKGMRQNFVVEKRIKGKGDLILDFRAGLNGVDINTNGKTLSIVMNVPGGSSVMKYGDMKVFDAKGRELAARMEKRGKDSFSIVVEDEEAVYPITIDPLSSTPDWTVESNQEYANLGYSVSTAGDVNGDGFSDVIVGVPYYDSGENNEGCAYVYYGSPTGLSTTPDWSVESNQSAAFFGISVSTAGDVNGDGFSDVIVGANSYTVDQANEGIANVYHGSTTGLSTTPDWTGESNQVNASFGFSVSTAGDVNGDGYSDVIIGALYYDNGETDEGRAYVYFGSSTGLSSLPDWIDEPNQEAAYYGWSVSTAGDVNGDGYSDVIVGAPYYDNGETNEGAAFVYFGSSSGLSITPDWTGESDQADSRYGYSVSTAGDVNGDGCSEVIVGAFYYDNGEYDEGAAFVYYGSSTGLSSTPDWTGESNQIDAYYGRSVSTAGDVNGDGYSDIIVGANHYNNVELNEGRAFVYYGSSSGLSTTPDWTGEPNQGDAEYGWSVSTAGDVNGDGYSDVIIGVWYYTNGETNEGAAFVYYGSPDSLSSSPDWMDESNQADAYFGVSVSTAGDVNGDGYSDVIVGAHYYDNGQTNEGAAFVYYGSGTGLSTTPDWTGESNQVNACFGNSVSTAGDVNGDGYSDVIVGAYYFDNGQHNEGRAYVYHGSVSGLSTTPNWTAESDQADARFGNSVSTAGDVNGDGYSDVIVGAYGYDNGQTNEGAAFVYYGSGSGLSTTPGWTGESNQADALFGNSVSTAGDVNGDGYSDVIVGAHLYDNGEPDEGRAFVYYGSGTGLSTIPDWTGESNQASARFGNSVSTAGDVNGDGYSDVIVGAYHYDNGQTDEGRAFVYYGSGTGLSITPDWTGESNQEYAYFGYSVSTAGDVNGDGYSDVIVGAYQYDNGESDEGAAFVYYGSGSGLSTAPDWMGESNQADAWFGNSVSTAGDVNGDGYSDVIVGAYFYDNGQTNEGATFVYYGNSDGIALVPQQMKTDAGSTPVQLLNATGTQDVRLKLIGRTPAGRGKVKLQWEIKELGQVMNGIGLGISSSWYDTDTNGIEIAEDITGLGEHKAYHWRVRLLYSPLNYDGSIYSRWLSIGPNGMNEKDFITTPLTGIREREINVNVFGLSIKNNISGGIVSISYSLNRDAYIRIKVYDVSGRVVKSIYKGRKAKGIYNDIWDTTDRGGNRVGSGIYFISLESEGGISTKKAIIVK